MNSSTEQIKEALSIVDVVSSYLKLEKAGTNYKTRCPFHNEKTPSFFVSPQRGSFYCFGCGAKGDIFSFVEQFEGVDFKGALKLLADRAGITLQYEDSGKKDEKDTLYKILEVATLFFEEKLRDNKKTLSYLEKRGLKKDSIEGWRIGFAPASWRELYEHLLTKGFREGEIKKTGLLKESSGRIYDTFRGRIMFPIMDNAGRVIAFSGRLFEEGGAAGKEAPKYVNTPETILFNKSKVLYGFHKAKQHIRPLNFSIVVEGQMDILMSHQTPFKNAVAISGTALTNDQLTRLKQLSSNIVLCFDSDSAGMRSSEKSALRALALGMDVKVASLPQDSDPADVILKNPDDWKKAIKESKHIIDLKITLLSEKKMDDRKFHLEVSKAVLPFISIISNKIEQSHFISKIASALNVSPEVVKEEVNKINPEDFSEIFSENSPKIKDANGGSADVFHTRKGLIERRLSGIILWQESLDSAMIDTKKLRENAEVLYGVLQVLEESKEDSSKYEDLIFEAEKFYKDPDILESEVEDLLKSAKEEALKEEYEEALKKLKEAENEGNEEEAEKMRKECREISQKIKTD